MNTTKILAELKAERSRLDQAINALSAIATTNGIAAEPVRRGRRGGRRRLSADARRRISEAAKKRWAALKKRG
jgi:hypothetical protein